MKHTTMKTILAALCTAAGAGLSTCAALPAEYQQLEYIQRLRGTTRRRWSGRPRR